MLTGLALALLGQRPSNSSKDGPHAPVVNLKLVRTVDVGHAFKAAISRGYIAAVGDNGETRLYSGKGDLLRTITIPRISSELTLDPDGTLCVGTSAGDVLYGPGGGPRTQTGIKSWGPNSVSKYAKRGMRWTEGSHLNTLLLVDSRGVILRTVKHLSRGLIEGMDSAPDGTVAILLASGRAGGHSVEILDTAGRLLHKFSIPDWNGMDWKVGGLSYDGERVAIERHDGVVCFSRVGKPLWLFPSLLERPNGNSFWIVREAHLVDTADQLAIEDLPDPLRDGIRTAKTCKIRIYTLPRTRTSMRLHGRQP